MGKVIKYVNISGILNGYLMLRISQIFLDNARDFYENIFFPECEKRGIKQILHLGDYYDHLHL